MITIEEVLNDLEISLYDARTVIAYYSGFAKNERIGELDDFLAKVKSWNEADNLRILEDAERAEAIIAAFKLRNGHLEAEVIQLKKLLNKAYGLINPV
jgi:hypothetical protein